MVKVEEVARAVCAANGEDVDQIILVENVRVPAWQLYVPDAEAAIAAMRRPSARMNDAGRRIDAYALRGVDSIYSAMIDEALKETVNG